MLDSVAGRGIVAKLWKVTRRSVDILTSDRREVIMVFLG